MQRILSLFCIILGWLPVIGQDHHTLLLDYYDGRITLSSDSAIRIASSVISAPKSTYYNSLAHYLLGYNQDISNDKIPALLSYLSALELLPEVDTTDLYLEVNVRKSLGFLLHEYQHYEYALAFYEKALPFAERYNDREQASLWYNMGFAYRKLDSVDLARASFKTSLALSEGNQRKQLQILNQSGLLEQQIEQYDQAAAYYQEIIDMKTDIPESGQRYLWMAYHNLGNVYLTQGRSDIAIDALQFALAFASAKNAFITYKDLGEAYETIAKMDEAQEVWNEAKNRYQYVSLHPDHFDVFKLIAMALPEDDPNRWHYFQKYTAELERYQQESDKIKELAARGYVGSLIGHYLDEVAEAKERETLLWQIGLFIAGMIVMFLAIQAWQWGRYRRVSGTLTGVKETLLNAISQGNR